MTQYEPYYKVIKDFMSKSLPVFLVLSYFFDGVSKLFRHIDIGSISSYFRMSFTLLLCVCVLCSLNLFLKRFALLLLFLQLLVAGWLVNGIEYNQNLLASFYIAFRYISFLIFLFVCFSLEPKHLAKTFLFIFLFNAVLAWLGFFFEIEVLRTYGHIKNVDEGWVDQRFGYNGLILEQNNATFFYLFGLAVCFYFWRLNKVSFKLLLFAIASCFLVGTKSLWGAVILLVISFFITNKVVRIFVFYMGSFSAILLVVVYHDYITYDFLNFLLSNRLNLLSDKFVPFFYEMNFFEFLLGVQGGDYRKFLVEMEFVDIFYFFGFLGLLLFFVLLLNGIFCSRGLFNYYFLMFVILFVAALSGHLFYDPVASFYFCFFILGCRELNHMKEHIRISKGDTA